MKKPKKPEPTQKVLIDLHASKLAKLDELSKDTDRARKFLIEQIVEQALDDPNFVLDLED